MLVVCFKNLYAQEKKDLNSIWTMFKVKSSQTIHNQLKLLFFELFILFIIIKNYQKNNQAWCVTHTMLKFVTVIIIQ
jgi:hypothetical protein